MPEAQVPSMEIPLIQLINILMLLFHLHFRLWIDADRFLNTYVVPTRSTVLYSRNNYGICVIDIR
jgi:hypothetical protein